jgi:galactitol-specific phosphotransferase system IIB component
MEKKLKAVILVCCGTAIATSTMVSEILRENLVRKLKYKIEFYQCATTELVFKVSMLHPDIIISTAPIDADILESWKNDGIFFFKGTPFLTGFGEEEVTQKVTDLLDQWEVREYSS